jgi:hypothetical protein
MNRIDYYSEVDTRTHKLSSINGTGGPFPICPRNVLSNPHTFHRVPRIFLVGDELLEIWQKNGEAGEVDLH